MDCLNFAQCTLKRNECINLYRLKDIRLCLKWSSSAFPCTQMYEGFRRQIQASSNISRPDVSFSLPSRHFAAIFFIQVRAHVVLFAIEHPVRAIFSNGASVRNISAGARALTPLTVISFYVQFKLLTATYFADVRPGDGPCTFLKALFVIPPSRISLRIMHFQCRTCCS